MKYFWKISIVALGMMIFTSHGRAQAFVQNCASSNSTTTASCTLSSVEAGDLIAALCMEESEYTSHPTISDNASNSYTFTPNSPSYGAVWIAYATNATGGNTTVSCTVPTGDNVVLWGEEFSGANELDTDAYATSGSGATINTPSITPSQSGEALVGLALAGGGITAASSGWTLDSVVNGNAAEHQIYSGTSSKAVNFTESGGTGWNAIEAAFKVTPPTQASGAGFTTLVFDDEFNSLNIAPSNTSSSTYNWYPGIWWESPGPRSADITGSSGVLSLDWNATYGEGLSPQLWDTSIEGESGSGSAGKSFRYGYFEARMKWDNVTGSWPAFWLLPTQGIGGATADTGEIDIFEGQGGQSNYWGTAITWDGSTLTWSNSPDNQYDVPGGTDFTQWHTYGALWTAPSGSTPGEIKWYFDNTEVGSTATTSSTNSLFDQQNFFLVLGSQEGVDWTAGDTTGVTASDIHLYVDWVRVWQD